MEYLWNHVETSEKGKMFCIFDLEGSTIGLKEAMATDTLDIVKKLLKMVQVR
jgi:hypothetical protein